jgi:hypothetical protein
LCSSAPRPWQTVRLLNSGYSVGMSCGVGGDASGNGGGVISTLDAPGPSPKRSFLRVSSIESFWTAYGRVFSVVAPAQRCSPRPENVWPTTPPRAREKQNSSQRIPDHLKRPPPPNPLLFSVSWQLEVSLSLYRGCKTPCHARPVWTKVRRRRRSPSDGYCSER